MQISVSQEMHFFEQLVFEKLSNPYFFCRNLGFWKCPFLGGFTTCAKMVHTVVSRLKQKNKRKSSETTIFCRNLVFVAKQQKPVLASGCWKQKNLIGHIRVFRVQRNVFSYLQKKLFFLPVAGFTVVVDWLLFIDCFGCCCCSCCLLFLLFVVLVFVQPIVVRFVLLQPIVLCCFCCCCCSPITCCFLGALFWFFVSACFCFCFASDTPKSHLPFNFRVVFPLFSPKTPFFKILLFPFLLPLSLWSFFFLLCFPSSSSDFSYFSCFFIFFFVLFLFFFFFIFFCFP